MSRRHMPWLLIAFLALLFGESRLGTLVVAEEQAGADKLELAFPDIDGFQKGKINRYPQPGLGYSIGYITPEKILATIYVYNGGLDKIPDGPGSEAVKQQILNAKGDIYELKKRGDYDTVTPRGDEKPQEVPLGKGAKALRLSFEIGFDGQKLVSYIFVTGYKNHFVKIRFSYPAAEKDKGEKGLQKVLTEVGTLLK
jgi:hypothetical protein